jgi:hypothetical protein
MPNHDTELGGIKCSSAQKDVPTPWGHTQTCSAIPQIQVWETPGHPVQSFTFVWVGRHNRRLCKGVGVSNQPWIPNYCLPLGRAPSLQNCQVKKKRSQALTGTPTGKEGTAGSHKITLSPWYITFMRGRRRGFLGGGSAPNFHPAHQ